MYFLPHLFFFLSNDHALTLQFLYRISFKYLSRGFNNFRKKNYNQNINVPNNYARGVLIFNYIINTEYTIALSYYV